LLPSEGNLEADLGETAKLLSACLTAEGAKPPDDPAGTGGRQASMLLVDGMNVIGSRPDGWWRDRTGAALRLAGRLAGLAATRPDPVVLVLDGRPSGRLGEGTRDGVVVLFARRGGPDAADDRIAEMVGADPDPASVEVVTSDHGLVERVTAAGAHVTSAGALLRLLDELG
jgi:predicted RNA-binding protein with PIN domain